MGIWWNENGLHDWYKSILVHALFSSDALKELRLNTGQQLCSVLNSETVHLHVTFTHYIYMENSEVNSSALIYRTVSQRFLFIHQNKHILHI